MRPRSRSAGLLLQQVGDQLVAYDQLRQRLHVLSPTAALTWRHCDGRHDVSDLAVLVSRELGIAPDERLIVLALEQLDEARLLEERLAPAAGADPVSRREMLHWAAAAAAGVFLPTITSCGAPLGADGPTAPSGPRLDLGVNTTTMATSFPPTTTLGTSFPPTTTLGTTFPPTTTGGTTFPPTTTNGTTFPPTTTNGTTFPPTTTIGTTFPPTTTVATSTTTFPPTTTIGTTTTTFPPTTTIGTTTTSSPPTTTTSTTPAPKKVQICHKGKSIMVDQRAVAAHLARGDTLGPCP